MNIAVKILTTLAFMLFCLTGFAQKDNKKVSFRDSTDSAIDMSDWLLNKKGFLLVPAIVTESAVGYGGAALLSIFTRQTLTGKRHPA